MTREERLEAVLRALDTGLGNAIERLEEVVQEVREPSEWWLSQEAAESRRTAHLN